MFFKINFINSKHHFYQIILLFYCLYVRSVLKNAVKIENYRKYLLTFKSRTRLLLLLAPLGLDLRPFSLLSPILLFELTCVRDPCISLVYSLMHSNA